MASVEQEPSRVVTDCIYCNSPCSEQTLVSITKLPRAMVRTVLASLIADGVIQATDGVPVRFVMVKNLDVRLRLWFERGGYGKAERIRSALQAEYKQRFSLKDVQSALDKMLQKKLVMFGPIPGYEDLQDAEDSYVYSLKRKPSESLNAEQQACSVYGSLKEFFQALASNRSRSRVSKNDVMKLTGITDSDRVQYCLQRLIEENLIIERQKQYEQEPSYQAWLAPEVLTELYARDRTECQAFIQRFLLENETDVVTWSLLFQEYEIEVPGSSKTMYRVLTDMKKQKKIVQQPEVTRLFRDPRDGTRKYEQRLLLAEQFERLGPISKPEPEEPAEPEPAESDQPQ
jgi:hypothetical protein